MIQSSAKRKSTLLFAVAFFMVVAVWGLMCVSDATATEKYILQPEEGTGTYEYNVENKGATLILKEEGKSGDIDYYRQCYQNQTITFKSDNTNVTYACLSGYSSNGLFCYLEFNNEGTTTIKAMKGETQIATCQITVNLPDIEERTKTSFDSGCAFLEHKFNMPVRRAESDNENICIVSTQSITVDDPYSDPEPQDVGEDGIVYIFPIRTGTCNITVTDECGRQITYPVTVLKKNLEKAMNIENCSYFKQHSKNDFDEDYYELVYGKNPYYGRSTYDVKAPYGSKVSLTIDGKKYSAKTERDEIARFRGMKFFKVGKKGKITVALGEKIYSRYIKVVSGSTVRPYYVKKNTKKVSCAVTNVTRGDYIIVKCGKKYFKKKKVNKSCSIYYATFKAKKKLKKKTLIKFYVVNKYKQKLAYKTYRVGRKISY